MERNEPVTNCDQLDIANIENRIYTIRGMQVMVDRDIADLYQVETKVLNQAVKRNIERFPERFRFQLTDEEKTRLVTNCDRLQTLKHSSVNPYVFTEQGIAMLSAVLHSNTAVKVSVRIMEAFVAIRKFLISNASIFQRLESLEVYRIETDKKLDKIFSKLEETQPKTEGVFFDGQIYDAYTFVASLIRKAKRKIVLIDNYVDDSVLTMMTKRDAGVTVTIYTARVSQQLQLDLDRHNAQYAPISIQQFNRAHDRFMIVDDEVYHIGASIKDLGKKWFAFTLMQDITPEELTKRL